ncbi:hypothetical protein PCH_Pc20g00070 [Penicillium rubens Wisconsin 54-1255]|uniref:Uncharacterized protein n=1 Tax=Penicillium rubens (strain ATCC 28089 / DSM 1075 / NRRL 1951 / Wisconsin 54-1255) TaxID=500485 RepID=B6HER5_PENRW|nr:hypothetical protein PCH_Pc20g00070 [Penicillium rubens Wisconsin 54-1255]
MGLCRSSPYRNRRLKECDVDDLENNGEDAQLYTLASMLNYITGRSHLPIRHFENKGTQSFKNVNSHGSSWEHAAGYFIRMKYPWSLRPITTGLVLEGRGDGIVRKIKESRVIMAWIHAKRAPTGITKYGLYHEMEKTPELKLCKNMIAMGWKGGSWVRRLGHIPELPNCSFFGERAMVLSM